MVWPAVPLLEEPKNLCTPKVQPVPVLASVFAAGGSRAWQGLVGRDEGWGRSPISATPCLLCLGCRDTFQAPSGGYRADIILLFGGWKE